MYLLFQHLLHYVWDPGEVLLYSVFIISALYIWDWGEVLLYNVYIISASIRLCMGTRRGFTV